MPEGIPDEGTDIGAIAANYISVTPLHLDLTDYPGIEQMRQWQWGQINRASGNGSRSPALMALHL